MEYFLGIDVGTGSARAGLFDGEGNLLAHHTKAIEMWQPRADFVEQSSDNIWDSIVQCCNAVRQDTEISAEQIKGIGFDATCSLVLLDRAGNPVTIDLDGGDEKNVIVWMDHRALKEADELNKLSGKHKVFEYVGGKISPEMQIPKLLWIKKHLPESWQQAAHFFDLPDYLTYRATGALTRSLCSMTCKWTYLAHEANAGRPGWQADFLEHAGLGELSQEKYVRVGQDVRPIGETISKGLSEKAALELGLAIGTKVGVSIIDAHAGGIGMIGMAEPEGFSPNLDQRLALIGGTSSCHMAVSKEQRPISGVWGPYYSAMVPGLWLNEGGQSATGALVDHCIKNHGASEEAKAAAEAAGQDIYSYLNQTLVALAQNGQIDTLTSELHVCPYFHGNRSPRANPSLKGMISGLRLSARVEDLARVYLATIQAIAYGTKHIIDAMNASGYDINTLVCCGGGTKNSVFMQQHANATGCRLLIPQEPESVLLGSAMLGAVAAGAYEDLQTAMVAMSRPGTVIQPQADFCEFHSAKYKIFHRLYEDQQTYAEIMRSYK